MQNILTTSMIIAYPVEYSIGQSRLTLEFINCTDKNLEGLDEYELKCALKDIYGYHRPNLTPQPTY